MKITRLDQRLRKKVNSILTIVPIVVCAFAIVSTSTAQSVSAVTASSRRSLETTSPAIP